MFCSGFWDAFPKSWCPRSRAQLQHHGCRCLCPTGLIHSQISLSFRVPHVWDPGRWEPPHGALVPQLGFGDGFPLPEKKSSFFLGDLFPVEGWANPQQLQAPIQSHIPTAEAGSLSPCVAYRLHGCSASFPAHPDPGKISASPNPHPLWTTRDSAAPSPAGSCGMGICASRCVGSLWSSSRGWGRSVRMGESALRRGMSLQHPWEWQLPSQAGPPSPSCSAGCAGKGRNQLSRERRF